MLWLSLCKKRHDTMKPLHDTHFAHHASATDLSAAASNGNDPFG